LVAVRVAGAVLVAHPSLDTSLVEAEVEQAETHTQLFL
jgi:hypothetical protein